MTSESKDSVLVVEFMTLFARLKNWCDNAPEELASFAKTDASVSELCMRLSFAVLDLRLSEKRHRALFSAPVNPAFVEAWRDYETRYDVAVSGVWFADITLDLEVGNPSKISNADFRWDVANEEALEQSSDIDTAIDFAKFNADQEWRNFPVGYVDQVQRGIESWEKLRHHIGFEPHGVFRRHELIPFVLIPRHIAAKYGSADKLSLLTCLQQAHDAFIFGATFAALALMRSILEVLLRDHYSVEGEKLEELINNAGRKLPVGVKSTDLDWLRRLANAILHVNLDKYKDIVGIDDIQLEKEIVSSLLVLRTLIEGAPKSSKSYTSQTKNSRSRPESKFK